MLSTVVLVSLGSISGCLGLGSQSTATETPTGVPLDSVVVRNESDKETKFTLTIVENGDAQNFHQITVPAGGSARPSKSWDESSETIVAVGMTKRYCNYEVVSLNESDGKNSDLAIEFRVDEQGDAHGTVLNATDV